MSTIQMLLPGEVAWCSLHELVYDSNDGDALYLNGEGVAYQEPGLRRTLDGEVVGFGEPGGLVSPLRIMMTEGWGVIVDASMVEDEEVLDDVDRLQGKEDAEALMRVDEIRGTVWARDGRYEPTVPL